MRTGIPPGVAVRAGTPLPDITTVNAFKQTLPSQTTWMESRLSVDLPPPWVESVERTIQGPRSVVQVLFFRFGGWRRSRSAVASTYCVRNHSSGCSPACAAGEAKNCAARTNFRNVASSSLLNRSRNEGSSLAVIEPRYSPDWGWTS